METGSEGVEEIQDGPVTWRFDRAFLRSNWACTWGRGCLGILAVPAEELQQGCCSVGAHLDDHEVGAIETLAELLEPARFQFAAAAAELGVVDHPDPERPDRPNTRVVEGACIFLNRPGFAGGAGCALHLQAEADGERPIDWKPSVCWQLPIHVGWEVLGDPADPDVAERATVRAWSRADWGDDGEPMHWCCTEGDRSYVGDRPVVESLAEELEALVGREVYVELRRRLTG